MSGRTVKGSLIRLGLEQMLELVEQGRLGREDVAKALGHEGAGLAPESVLVSSWYPVELYDRMLGTMMRVAGGGRPEFLVDFGRRAAQQLARSGLYHQLDRRPGQSPVGPLARLLLTLSKALYGFTEWELGEIGPDGDRFEILVSEAAGYPETLRWRNVGFIEAMTSQATGEPWTVTSERPTAACIRFVVRRG